jgi:NAD+ synthase (glutamine-hydrolysing)
MKHGFTKVAAAIPGVRVADCNYNITQIQALMLKASEAGAQLVAFPELSVTAYTCMDLFSGKLLLDQAEKALVELVHSTRDLPVLAVVGMPLRTENRLINAAVVFQQGKILGVVPKTYLPNYKEFQEQRWFSSASDLKLDTIRIGNASYPMGGNLLFETGNLTVGIELCEDLWVPVPPSSVLAMLGANVIVNLSASNELIGKNNYLRNLICQQSARCISGYVYASAGFGESTTDLVFAGNALIAENGSLLAASKRFEQDEQLIISEIDIDNLEHDRQVNTGFSKGLEGMLFAEAVRIPFDATSVEGTLTRTIDPHPFVPEGAALTERCEEIFDIQVSGLANGCCIPIPRRLLWEFRGDLIPHWHCLSA